MFSIKKILVVSGLALSISNAFAIALNQPCPSVEDLADFDGDIVLELPMTYETTSNTLNQSLIQIKDNPRRETTAFILSGINTGKNQAAESLAQNLIGQLILENEYPVKYQLTDSQYIPLCSYSIPGNNSVRGLVFSVSHNVKHGWVVNTIQHLTK